MAVLETQVRGEIPAVVDRRPGTAGPDNRFGRKRPARCHGPAACALGERRPRHSSSPDSGWTAPPFQTGEGQGGTDAPRARRPVGRPVTTDAGVGRRRASHRWAAIVIAPTFPPSILATAASRRLSASICGQIAMDGMLCDGFVSSCLRVCDAFLCVSLCVLCASVVERGALIRNIRGCSCATLVGAL